jgi:energy-coupling factor transport system ATP-binding protein
VLLAAISGLEPHDQVEIDWDRPSMAAPAVALQYPELQIFEETVADELAFAAVSRGVARAQVLSVCASALEDLGYDHRSFMKRRTWDLAGGERRIMEVLGALVSPANLVILDEPTAGIDRSRRAALTRLILARAATSCVVVATQDLEWLRALAFPVVTIGSAGPITQVTT